MTYFRNKVIVDEKKRFNVIQKKKKKKKNIADRIQHLDAGENTLVFHDIRRRRLYIIIYRSKQPSPIPPTFVLDIISDNYFIKILSNNYSAGMQIPAGFEWIPGSERNGPGPRRFLFEKAIKLNFALRS